MNPDSKSSDYKAPIILNDFLADGSASTWRVAEGPPRESDGKNSVRALLLGTFLLRWKVILPAGVVLAGVVAAILIWRFVPQYRSYAIVEIRDVAPFVAFPSGSARDGQQYVQTQIELLRSPVVLEPVVIRPEVRQIGEIATAEGAGVDPVDYLAERLQVRQIGRSELYRVEFTGKDALDAQSIVNAVIVEYLEAQDDESVKRTRRVIELLEDQQDARQLLVEDLREHVVDLSEKLTGQDPYIQRPSASGVAADSLANLSTSLTQTKALQEELKVQIQAYEGMNTYIPSMGESQLLTMEVNTHPDVTALKREVEHLRAFIASRKAQQLGATRDRVRGRYDSQYDQQLAETLRRRELALETTKKQVRGELAQTRRLARQTNQMTAIENLSRELEAANERYRVLNEQYEKETLIIGESGPTSVQLQFAKEKLAREERIFELIASRKLALETEMQAPARVMLRLPPVEAKKPAEALPYKPLTAGCLIAFLVPFALAVAWESVVQRVGSANQLKEGSHLPVLAEVARYPAVRVGGGSKRLSRQAERNLGIIEECIDGLRTTLTLSDNTKAAGVLTVTSAVKAEGKTTISIQLAYSLARTQRRPTLLIDGDTRSPDVHRTFDLPLAPGFAEVLAGDCELADAVHQIDDGNLYVLPAGGKRGSPHQHIHGELFDQLLKKSRERFQHVVVDSPPVLSASESLILARHADAVLFCCMRDVTKVGQVQAAIERLTRARANLCGAVLSGTPLKSYAYRYDVYPYADAESDREV